MNLLVAGGSQMCGTRPDGVTVCSNAFPVPVPPVIPEGLVFQELAVGPSYACGRTADTQVHCWGSLPAPPPTTTVSMASGHRNWACGLEADGCLQCWGDVVFSSCGMW